MSNNYFSQTRQEIAPLIPSKVDVALEIGCGAGKTLQWLKKSNFVNSTVGFELNQIAADEARAICDEIIMGNIEQQAHLLDSFKGSIDLLLFLDVLEHLKEPGKVLENCRSLLSNTGVIIASIPNVRNVKVIGPLVFRGQWNYQDAGILDRTHLRFFTRESAIKLFTDNGYQVETVVGNGPLKFDHIKTFTGAVVCNFNIITLGFFEEFFAQQYLILARSI